MPPNLFGHTMSGLRTRQAAVAGLKAVETPSTSCESCHALSALFPIAGPVIVYGTLAAVLYGGVLWLLGG